MEQVARDKFYASIEGIPSDTHRCGILVIGLNRAHYPCSSLISLTSMQTKTERKLKVRSAQYVETGFARPGHHGFMY